MTDTLGSLKAEIADDLARSDLTTQIASAITRAIKVYWTTRFYFNETRASTFLTVATQSLYTSSTSADIPNFFDFDDVFVTVSGWKRPLVRDDADTLDSLIGSSGATGDPIQWAWVNQSILLYPIPNAVRTITIVGAIKIDAPTADGDSTNVWIAEGYELIRRHAKALIYTHVIKDMDQAQTMLSAAESEKERLERETSGKRATGVIRGTSF